MAFPESNRKAIIDALEKLQLKLNSLQNEKNLKSDQNIQIDCYTPFNDSELSNKVKETEFQCTYLTEQIKKIYMRLDIAEKERLNLDKKIQQFQSQSCSNIHGLFEMQQEHNLAVTHSQPILENQRSTRERQSRSDLFMKSLKCGAMSFERCNSPIFSSGLKIKDLNDLKDNSIYSSIHTNYSHPNNYFNDLPVKDNTNNPQLKENKYQFDFSNMPFTVGKSISRSHSLMANFQEVLSLMKQNPKFFSDNHSQKFINAKNRYPTKTQQVHHSPFQPKNSLHKHHKCSRCGFCNSCKIYKSEILDSENTMHLKQNYVNGWNSHCLNCGYQMLCNPAIRSRSAASFKLLKNIQKMQEALKTDIVWVP